MPLLTAQIRTILEGQGLITFPTTTKDFKLIDRGTRDIVVDNNYAKLNLTASLPNNTITLTRVDNNSTTSNGVDIKTIDVMATLGSISPPGYIYTGDFTGCVFYLYKTGPNQITGVHAYSGTQAVTNRTGVFRRKVVNMVVCESGPTNYFTRNPAQQICRYPTRSELDLSTGELSLAFLSCVEATSATTFLFSAAGSAKGARVKRLVRTYHVKF